MHPKRHPKRPREADRSASRSAPKRPQGFAGLDPAKMGFEVPPWLEESANADASAETSSLLRQDGAVSEISQVRTVVEGMKVVCICKGIRKRVFWRALDEGMCTKEEINRHTGSGSGSCQGRRCGPRILDMLRRLSE